MSKLREKEINPVVIIGVAVVALLAAGYFFWLGPAMNADRARRDWNTAEAAERRAPENRRLNPAYEKALREIQQREGTARVRRTGGRRE